MLRNELKMLEYEVKKKPHIQAIIDNFDNIKFEDIDEIQVLPWIKKALKLKFNEIKTKKILDIDVSIYETTSYNDDYYGSLRIWNKSDTYIKFGRNQMLIQNNEKFFITSNGVWIGDTFSSLIDNQLLDCFEIKKCKWSEREIIEY